MNWTVEGRGDTFAIVDQDDVEVATVPYTAETGDDPLDTAEGRRAVLLSAAPEILSALEGVMQLIEDGLLVRSMKQDGDPSWAMKQLPLVMTLSAAAKAIYKAKGVQ